LSKNSEPNSRLLPKKGSLINDLSNKSSLLENALRFNINDPSLQPSRVSTGVKTFHPERTIPLCVNDPLSVTMLAPIPSIQIALDGLLPALCDFQTLQNPAINQDLLDLTDGLDDKLCGVLVPKSGRSVRP